MLGVVAGKYAINRNLLDPILAKGNIIRIHSLRHAIREEDIDIPRLDLMAVLHVKLAVSEAKWDVVTRQPMRPVAIPDPQYWCMTSIHNRDIRDGISTIPALKCCIGQRHKAVQRHQLWGENRL